MKISDISFPVYKLKQFKPHVEDGVTFYLTEKNIQIVDDSNIEGNSLARRRLTIAKELFPLRIAIFFLADLIKIATPETWFIDNTGKLFQYKKSKMVTLTFRKIVKVIKTPGASVIEVQGINSRFMSLYPPRIEQKFAGILNLDGGYILYGFFDSWHENTRRKI